MAFSVSPIIGATFTSTSPTNVNSAGLAVPTDGPLGLQAFGSDGKLYVLAKAAVSIAASNAVVSVSPSTFLATASGGSYLSPAFALVSGDVAWFAKASV
jgi:hypothetical protein